ncbi:helix-turn-helix domain-containing protein [Chryseobacterium sp. JK1]|uniref:helix-turn-helix domain-containing protein n=1 Tax=Chryseobacterium sp. JK1 TaxID=874294 RepID=UPI003D691287
MDINKDLRIHIGKQISVLRTKKKLTQQDLEFFTGIDTADISKYESGKINLTLRTILKFATALQVHPKELFDFEFDITQYKVEN